jgi:hypothetical protein
MHYYFIYEVMEDQVTPKNLIKLDNTPEHLIYCNMYVVMTKNLPYLGAQTYICFLSFLLH